MDECNVRGSWGALTCAGSSTTSSSLPSVHRIPHLPTTPLLYLRSFVAQNMSRHDRKREAEQQPQRHSHAVHSEVSPLDSAELAQVLLPVSATPARSRHPPVVPIDQQFRNVPPLHAQTLPGPFSDVLVYNYPLCVDPEPRHTLYSPFMLPSYSARPLGPPSPDHAVVCPRDIFNLPAPGSAGAPRHESSSCSPAATLGSARASVPPPSEP